MAKKTPLNINIVIFLALCIAASLVFISQESAHDCSGEGCHVCVIMRYCQSLVRGFLFAAAIFCALHSSGERAGAQPFAARYHAYAITPITLKVKLTS